MVTAPFKALFSLFREAIPWYYRAAAVVCLHETLTGILPILLDLYSCLQLYYPHTSPQVSNHSPKLAGDKKTCRPAQRSRKSGCVLFILFKYTLGLYVVQFSVTKYYIHIIQGHHNKESPHDFWPSWCTSHFSSPVENIMGFDYCRRDPQVPCAGQTFWLNSQRVPPEGVAKVRVGWVSVEFMLSKEMQEIWNWL